MGEGFHRSARPNGVEFLEGDGCAEGIYGWVNNEEQSYDEAGVSIDGGSFVALGGAQRVTGI